MGTAMRLPQAGMVETSSPAADTKGWLNPALSGGFSLAKHLRHPTSHLAPQNQGLGGCTLEEEAPRQLIPTCPNH